MLWCVFTADYVTASPSSLQAQQVRSMFPHVPLQAITLDLADTRSISLTVEHILNNAIYIPETGTTGVSQTLNSATAHMSSSATPSQAPETPAPESQAPESQAPPTDVDTETTPDPGQSVVRRRHRREGTAHHESDGTSELIRDNRSGVPPPEEVGSAPVAPQSRHEGGGTDIMAFSSLQRRKRELLANAKRSVCLLMQYICI